MGHHTSVNEVCTIKQCFLWSAVLYFKKMLINCQESLSTRNHNKLRNFSTEARPKFAIKNVCTSRLVLALSRSLIIITQCSVYKARAGGKFENSIKKTFILQCSARDSRSYNTLYLFFVSGKNS